jgi:tRNA 2-thiocytidine biosynthesis protein TtcA
MFTGRTSSLPAITWSSQKDFRLIRPLVYVTEDITLKFAQSLGAPVIPCGCSQKTGTVRRSLRDVLADLERDYPRLKESLLSAMGNIEHSRMLDTRYLSLDGEEEEPVAAGSNPFRVLGEEL